MGGDQAATAIGRRGVVAWMTPNVINVAACVRRDRRKIGGAAASWLFSRLFSGRGWMRGLDVEVGEDRG